MLMMGMFSPDENGWTRDEDVIQERLKHEKQEHEMFMALLQLKAENEDLKKQLQQLKADDEKLCTAIRNELSEQYDKRVSEAEGDIEWGVLDRNATEAEFCKNVILETRNYIAKLEQENEKLSTQNYYLDKANLGLAEENEKYLQCLDECLSLIEKEVNPYDTLLIIKNNIKGVLENE